MVKIQDTDIPYLEFAEAAAPSTPASGIVRAYAKTDSLLYQKDDTGAETALGGVSLSSDIQDALNGAAAPDSGNVFATMADVGGGGGSGLILPTGSPVIVYTASNITLNNTNWMELAAETGAPGTGGFDFDFTGVVAGDIAEFSLNGFLNNAAVYANFDVATIVAASPVNYFGGATVGGAGAGDGVTGWYGVTSREESISGSAFRTLVSGDLSGGALKLRPYFRTQTATNRTLFAVGAIPFQLMARVWHP